MEKIASRQVDILHWNTYVLLVANCIIGMLIILNWKACDIIMWDLHGHITTKEICMCRRKYEWVWLPFREYHQSPKTPLATNVTLANGTYMSQSCWDIYEPLVAKGLKQLRLSEDIFTKILELIELTLSEIREWRKI